MLLKRPICNYNFEEELKTKNSASGSIEMMIGRQGAQAVVFDWMAYGEMIENLVAFVLDAQQTVDLIVEKTAYPGAAQAMGLCCQV